MWGAPYIDHFRDSRSTLATIGLVVVVSAVLAAAAPRRRRSILATGVALAAILGTTLAPAAGWSTFGFGPQPWAAVTEHLRPHRADFSAWARTGDGPLNVVLYVPFGATLALLLRRPAVALGIAVATSGLIESYQAAAGSRVGTFADVVSNGLGAAIGAALGAGWLLNAVPTRE